MSRSLLAAALAAASMAALSTAGAMLPHPAAAHESHAGHGEHAAKGLAAGEPGMPNAPSRTVEIVMRDENGVMAFSPNSLEVKQGEQVRFVLKNVGAIEHEFLIDTVANNAAHKEAMAADEDMEHEEPNGRHLKPGEQTELIWRFTNKGTFEIACLIPGHYELGMKGEVQVK
ncbi:MAG: plastocyanin/azurin family copper-binding protein [Hyphomicrobium sp.]